MSRETRNEEAREKRVYTLPRAAVFCVYTPRVLECVKCLVCAYDASDSLGGIVVKLEMLIQNLFYLSSLVNLGAQDVDEVGCLGKLLFGHDAFVEDGRASFVAHRLELCARLGTQIGFLVDPLDEVAALVVRKEPHRARARKVDLGLQHRVIGTIPSMSLVNAGSVLTFTRRTVKDGFAILRFVDDDPKDCRLDDDLVFRVSVSLHELVDVLGAVDTEGEAR
jgi:hypothetical protein